METIREQIAPGNVVWLKEPFQPDAMPGFRVLANPKTQKNGYRALKLEGVNLSMSFGLFNTDRRT